MVAVIGTKDLIPPQGRVGVELYDPDTGRVKKKVHAENAIMDWVGEQTTINQGRGPGAADQSGINYQSGLSPVQALIENGEISTNAFGASFGNRDLIYQAGAWPWTVPPYALNLWLWANESTATPNAANRHIPSTNATADVVAGCYLGKQFAADGVQNKRGYIDLASCERNWTRTRIVAEFLPGIGTGTYRSIGLGSLVSQEGVGTPGGLKIASFPCKNWDFSDGDQYQLSVAQFVKSTSANWGRAGWDPDEDVLYAQTDVATSIAWRGDMKDAATGESYSHGFGNVELGHAPLTGAGNFWIGYNQNLVRCNRDVAVPYFSAVETIDISASLGAESIREITDNGTDTIWVLTDTRVFTFDAGGTKTITGNWSHGVTLDPSRAQQFAYDAVHDCLWLTPSATPDLTDIGWGHNPSTGSTTPMSSLISRAFTTAGADIPALRFATPQCLSGSSTSTQDAYGPATFFGNGRWFFKSVQTSTTEYGFVHANGTMASHALLPSDVVKGPGDALRLTYDFNF